jgi:hypothetical protein
MTWQPIETAERAPYRERFLGVVDGEVRLIMWTKTSHVPIYGWCLVDQGAEDCDLCTPTHWQPLPAPPEPAGRRRRLPDRHPCPRAGRRQSDA